MYKSRLSVPLYPEKTTNVFNLLMDDDISDDNDNNIAPKTIEKKQLKNNDGSPSSITKSTIKSITESDKHSFKHTNKTEKYPNKQLDRHSDRYSDRQSDKHSDKHPDRQSDKHFDRHFDRQSDRFHTNEITLNDQLMNDQLVNDGSLYVPPTDSWSSSSYSKRRKNKFDKYRDDPHDRNNDDDDTENDKKDYPVLAYYDPMKKMPGDDLKLNSSWNVWIHDNSNDDWSLGSYTSIFTIDSIGSMWRFLSVFDNLDKNVRQYYIMRNGITPIWEDNNNKHGAICSIMIDNVSKSNKISKGDLGVDAFSSICILVMNESFVRKNQDINGLCYSIKSRSALIKLWVKDYELNKKYGEKLPITILKSFDSAISNMEGRSAPIGGKSRISVQTKQIKPNY